MDDFERIKARLAHSHYHQIRTVEVHLENHRIVLTGTVRTFYMKQMAQEIAMTHEAGHLLNGTVIENQIKVSGS